MQHSRASSAPRRKIHEIEERVEMRDTDTNVNANMGISGFVWVPLCVRMCIWVCVCVCLSYKRLYVNAFVGLSFALIDVALRPTTPVHGRAPCTAGCVQLCCRQLIMPKIQIDPNCCIYARFLCVALIWGQLPHALPCRRLPACVLALQ